MMTKAKQKKKRKGFGKAIFWIKFILILVLFGVTLVLLLRSPLFNITKIDVEGSTYYEEEIIVNATGITIGNNAFEYMTGDLMSVLGLRFTSVEKKVIKNCHYVKDVNIKYSLPSRVMIEIFERKPIGIIPYLGTSLLMDEEGYIIDTVDAEKECEFPLIKGVRFERFELGQKPDVQNPESIKKVVEVINIIDRIDRNSDFKIYSIIDSIDVSNGDINLFLDSRLIVNFGDMQNLRYRMNILKHIYINNLSNNDRGLIDFTIAEDPIFIPEE